MHTVSYILLLLLSVLIAEAQVTAAGGHNVKDRVKKHEELNKVWTHSLVTGWKSSVDFSVNSASGNSESSYYTAAINLDKKRGQNDYFVKVSYAYGEDGETKSMDELLGLLSWKRTGSGGYYTGARFDYRQDALADIDFRAGSTLLQGYNLYQSEKGWVTPEIGFGYARQKIGGELRDSVNFYMGIHAEYWLDKKTRFYTSLTSFTPTEKNSDYYLWGELGVETMLSDRLSLKLYFQDAYENNPAPGRERNDLRFIAGISVKL